jgi:hypothetical protein
MANCRAREHRRRDISVTSVKVWMWAASGSAALMFGVTPNPLTDTKHQVADMATGSTRRLKQR